MPKHDGEEGAGPASDFRLLKLLRFIAVSDASLIAGISYFVMTGFRGLELAPLVLSLSFAGFFYGLTFYFGCLILAPNLKDYIVSDDTVIRGDSVDMDTTTRASGDPEADKWIAAFVFARNLFGMALVPMALLGGLFLFG